MVLTGNLYIKKESGRNSKYVGKCKKYFYLIQKISLKYNWLKQKILTTNCGIFR